MKLLNFNAGQGPCFGLAVDNMAVSFSALTKNEADMSMLQGILPYLENLPDSFEAASALNSLAHSMVANGETSPMLPLDQVKILPPLPCPAALLDFGLSPRHLKNSTATMMKHVFGGLKGKIITKIVERKIDKASKSDVLMYYKGNHLEIIGHGDEVGWPAYTSYLDIEPELAFVTGNHAQKIAGYLIFNDASARDVQFPEMTGLGPSRSKDFERGNGLGPFIVTPDEVPDPLSLDVTVDISGRMTWKGHTSQYTVTPEKVVDFLETVYPVKPGMVIGMGTVPGCAGLDTDQWIVPGDSIDITFTGLGTLNQKIPSQLPKLQPSSWGIRKDL